MPFSTAVPGYMSDGVILCGMSSSCAGSVRTRLGASSPWALLGREARHLTSRCMSFYLTVTAAWCGTAGAFTRLLTVRVDRTYIAEPGAMQPAGGGGGGGGHTFIYMTGAAPSIVWVAVVQAWLFFP